MPLDPVAVSGVVAGFGAIGWMIWRDRKEKQKTSDLGLNDNPIRCAEHSERLGRVDDKLGKLEQRAARLETRMDGLEKCADEIKDEIRKLRN